jgi:phosphoadenosine phosphosulfate reductase
MTKEESLREARERLKGAGAAQVLAWADARFGERAGIASSFGVEDVVLIDLAAQHAPRLRVFTLDTGRLPPETYEVMEQVRRRYGISIESYFPDRAAVEKLEREKGFFSFKRSIEERKECCAIRKLEPLSRALTGRDAWVTGLRREQSPTRAAVETVEIDERGLFKLSPLADWSEAQIWKYARDRQVPLNALHAQGYPSIGCAPCTRPVAPGEDVRAGRWWWESPEHKECGLHGRRS